jgi:hypothetical protein
MMRGTTVSGAEEKGKGGETPSSPQPSSPGLPPFPRGEEGGVSQKKKQKKRRLFCLSRLTAPLSPWRAGGRTGERGWGSEGP